MLTIAMAGEDDDAVDCLCGHGAGYKAQRGQYCRLEHI